MKSRKMRSASQVRLVPLATYRDSPSLVWRIEYFLRSPRNLVGMLFAAIGLIVVTSGIPVEALAIALVAGLYAIGYLLIRPRRMSPFEAAEAPETWKVRESLDELLHSIRMRVSDDVYRRVQSIRDAIVFTLENSHGMTEADPNIYLTRQTATIYLPEALSTYLALPRLYAERETVTAGRTSHDVLLDQLYQMDAKMGEVAEEVMRKGSDDLVAHGRFLADRYAGSSLKVGGSPATNELPQRTNAAGGDRARVA